MINVWSDEVLFKTVAGSYLYGTNTETSDVDIRGVCRMPDTTLLGLQGFEQYQPTNAVAPHPLNRAVNVPADLVVYGLNKFAILAMECNPNIIELLFAKQSGPTCYTMTDDWDRVLDIRAAFLSRKARHSFSGYAASQIKRMETHHRWLTDKPPVEPKYEDYGGYITASGNVGWQSEQRHQNYSTDHGKYVQYCGWLANRNPARHALEEKFGCDTKNAMHAYRLFTQGVELLETGSISLPRPDAAKLLEIKNGSMTYDQLMQWASDMDGELDKIEANSVLPWGPDKQKVEQVVMHVNARYLNNLGYGYADKFAEA